MIKKIIISATTSAILLIPGAANAKSLEDKYSGLYHSVKNKYGSEVSGRNLRKEGVRIGPDWREPKGGEYSGAIKRLRIINKDYIYLSKKFTSPYYYPGKIPSSKFVPRGLAACIAFHEGRNDPFAQNGQYKGTAQWSPEAWSRHGGHKFGPTPFDATYQEQLIVLNDGLTRYGCRDWCPFDPCG